MYNNIISAWIKMKKSSSKYCFLFIPLTLLIFTLTTLISPNNPSGMIGNVPITQMTFFNLWPIILSHITIVLGIYFNLKSDEDSGSNLQALSNNWDFKKIFLAKSMVLTIYLGISYLILFFISIVSIYIITGTFQNVPLILVTTILMFLGQICLIQINILLLRYLNVLFVLIFNLFINIICVVYISLTKLFWLIPQGYAIKVATITMAIHPNGTPLDKNSIYYYNNFNNLHSLGIVLLGSCLITIIFIKINLLVKPHEKYL